MTADVRGARKEPRTLTFDKLTGILHVADAGKDSARARVAARQVRKLREMLGHVLDNLDADVDAAIRAAECLGPAPF